MREGHLLAEESPNRLLSIFNTETLEEVFLILSRRQEEGRLDNLSYAISDDQNNSVIERGTSTTSVATFDIAHGSTDVCLLYYPFHNIFKSTRQIFHLKYSSTFGKYF